MRMTGSRVYTRSTAVPKMPAGLVELMEGVTKEVLTCNPPNVYEFCAAHMEKLLTIRDGSTAKRILTLDEKILRAQNKIKLRAQQRWQNYDKEMLLVCDARDKDEKLPQKDFIKGPVPNEMCLTNVEEIEISHKPISDLNSCKNYEEIEETKNELLPIEGDISNYDDRDTNNINGSTDSDNSKFHIKDKEPIFKQNCDVPVTNNFEALDRNKSPKINESSELCDNTMIIEMIKESTANDVVGDGESLTPVVEDEERKETERAMTPSINQDIEQKLEENTLRNEEYLNIDINDKMQDLKPASKDESHANTKDDFLIHNQSSNPTNMDLVAKDKIDCYNPKLGDINNDFEKKIINQSDNLVNSEDTCENLPNIAFVLQTPTLDKTESSQDLTKQEKVFDNDILSDKILPKNGNSMPIVALRILEDTGRHSHSLDKETNLNEKDIKGDGESQIHKKMFKSDLADGILPPSNVDVYESSSETVSNDIRATSNMDLETAAITIQKVFRSFLFKNRASHEEVSSIDEDNKEAIDYATTNKNKERRPLCITRMDTMLQTVNEEKSLSLSTDDSSTLSSAATIIQAHIRGFLIRNKLNSNKTVSTNSLLNSEDPVTTSMENASNQTQNNSKTILNIHIVPEGGVPLSRDESIVTSIDLSLDGSPPSSINLHPLGYNKSEPRKQLKREDAIQSISPPSNNSGKLSEDVESTKEVLMNDVTCEYYPNSYSMSKSNLIDNIELSINPKIVQDNPDSFKNILVDAVEESNTTNKQTKNTLTKMSSDEMDVVTPFTQDENQHLPESDNSTKLLHSGELHDVVLPTNVTRSSTSVVREFKAVLVYFLLWNK